MPTIKERLQALEQGHQAIDREQIELKKTIELQTIAIRALVSKASFEKLQETVEKSLEQNGKLFDTLITHDRFTNEQLAELRAQQIELDGKIVGLQTETRQRFNEQDGKIAGLDSKVAGLDSKVAGLDSKVTGLDSKVAELDSKVTGLNSKVAGLQTEMRQRFNEQDSKFAEHTALLQQILKRLAEK